MKVLVTGASGFLGSALSLKLQEQGNDVSLLVRPQSDLKRLEGYEDGFRIKRFTKDKEVCDFVRESAPDAIIHAACVYGRGRESVLDVVDANLRFGLCLLQAVSDTKQPVNFINTGTALAPEVSAYALSKCQFRQWGQWYTAQSGENLRFVNVLLQHMYGPGDDPSKFTTHVLHACHRNEPVLKLTAGEQVRDFIYIDDVVSAFLTILLGADDLGPVVDIPVGSGEAPSVREFVETVHAMTHSTTELQFGAMPYRRNEAMHCQADITQMQKLGWKPRFDLVSGISKTIELEF